MRYMWLAMILPMSHITDMLYGQIVTLAMSMADLWQNTFTNGVAPHLINANKCSVEIQVVWCDWVRYSITWLLLEDRIIHIRLKMYRVIINILVPELIYSTLFGSWFNDLVYILAFRALFQALFGIKMADDIAIILWLLLILATL